MDGRTPVVVSLRPPVTETLWMRWPWAAAAATTHLLFKAAEEGRKNSDLNLVIAARLQARTD